MARRTKEPAAPLVGEDLRSEMRIVRDGLIERIRKGYGDERNRHEIEIYRERMLAFRAQDPEMWAEVAAELKGQT